MFLLPWISITAAGVVPAIFFLCKGSRVLGLTIRLFRALHSIFPLHKVFLHLVNSSSVSLMVRWCSFKQICLIYITHRTASGRLGFANVLLFTELEQSVFVCSFNVCACVCMFAYGGYIYVACGGQKLASVPQLLSTVLRQGLSLESTGLWLCYSSCPACSRDTLSASWLLELQSPVT